MNSTKTRTFILSNIFAVVFAFYWITSYINILQEYIITDKPISSLEQESPHLIKLVRQNYLIPPTTDEIPYNLKRPDIQDTSQGQSDKIKEIFSDKTDGIFIECGALDGETRSNTLFFERYRNWTGLLIEGDPLNVQQIKKKNRKAWLAPVCLSLVPRPTLVLFAQHFNTGRIKDEMTAVDPARARSGLTEVQCMPLVSLLLALNITSIDYFSLDVEGDELKILKTIPFDRFDIKTLSVEFAHTDEGKVRLRQYMENQGYAVHSEIRRSDGYANDFIFMKNNTLTYDI